MIMPNIWKKKHTLDTVYKKKKKKSEREKKEKEKEEEVTTCA